MSLQTMILRPNSDISIAANVWPSDSTIYNLINEVSPDDDATYFYLSWTSAEDSGIDHGVFTFGTPSIEKKINISKISLFLRYKYGSASKGGSGCTFTPKIKLSDNSSTKYTISLSTISYDKGVDPDNIYKDITMDVSDSDISTINSLLQSGDTFQIEFDMSTMGGGVMPTQTYITIEYDPGITFYKKVNDQWGENIGFLYKYENNVWTKQETIPSHISSILTSSYNISIPNGYTLLQYIESNGRQYIDTGIKPKYDSRVVLDISNLTSVDRHIFGAKNADSGTASDQFSMIRSTSTTIISDYFGTNETIDMSDTISRFIIDKNANITKINGEIVTTNTPISSGASDYNMYLFGCNTANDSTKIYPSTYKLYSCQIYDNGVLVRDYIPVLNSEYTVGLYDLVNNTFYPMQKVKVENKIYINTTTTTEEYPEGDWATTKLTQIKSTYPAASDLSIKAGELYISEENTWNPYYYEVDAVIGKGYTVANYSAERVHGYDENGEYFEYGSTLGELYSVSPTEDDDFYYVI